MKRIILAMAAAGLSSTLLGGAIAFDEPGTAHWTNASGDSCWTNPANWAEGKVPGQFVCSFESSTDLRRDDLPMFGVAGCTAVFGAEAAMVAGSPIRLGGLYSISNVVIESDAAAPFTFGSGAEPPLPIERGGSLWVKEGVTSAVTVNAELAPGAGGPGGAYPFVLRNDGSGVLETYSIGAVSKFQNPPSWTALTRTLRGTGEIRRRVHFFTDGFSVSLLLEMSGGVYAPGSATASAQNGYGGITAADTGFCQHVRIDSGKRLYISGNGQWARPIMADGDLLIDGDGALLVNASGWAANFSVAEGKTLTIACDLDAYAGTLGYSLYPGSKGTLVMDGDFLKPANPTVPAGTLQVGRIGKSGEASPLGTGDGATLSGGALRYAGEGETTDRVLTLTTASTLEQAGTGDLVFTSAPAGTSALTLRNAGSTAAVAFAASVTTPLVLASDARLAAVCAEGASEASITFGSLTLAVGDHVLRADDGVALTVSSLTLADASATLDIVGDGEVTVSGLEAGLLPVGVTRNGDRACVDASGKVTTIDDAASISIDARGGVVPNAAASVVAIATATGETAGMTLAADETAALALRQEQTVEPARLTVGAGQTFSPQMVEIADGAQPLVFVGEGTVSPFALKGDGVLRTNEAAGTGVRLAGDGKATVSLNGALTDASPLDLRVTEGAAQLTGAGDVPAAIDVGDGGSLTLAEGSFRSAGLDLGDASDPTPALLVGTNGVGTLCVEGGSWTGRVAVATGGGTGAVFQRGGEVVNVSGTSGEIKWLGGGGGLGYYALTGGRFVSAGASLLGQSSVAIFDVRGGTLACAPSSVRKMGALALGGWEASASLAVGAGGKVDFADSGVGAGAAAILAPYYSRWRTEATFTVEDGGEVDLGTGVYCAGYGYSDAYRPSVLNLNGGTFRAHSVSRPQSTVYPSDEFPNGTATDARYANCPVYVNFGGGTFRPTSWLGIFGANTATAAQPPTRITLFAGGATIDVSGVDCELSPGGGLKAPTGKGVASVALDDAVRARTFAAPPFVRIAGDGFGATAVAEFDAATRRVTGIRVTSPGWDYGTAEAQLLVGKETVAATLPATLADNVSGGLTKTGAGVLRVAATNDYTGATRICAGTVRLLGDGVFSAESALVLDGGTLDLNGHSQTFADITCNGGTVTNGAAEAVGQVGLAGLTVDFAAAATGAVKRVDESFCRFAEGAALTVLNFDASALSEAAKRRHTLVEFARAVPTGLSLPTLDLPDGWVIKASGRRIVLVRERGSVLIVR